jgi:hypothetical protein
VARWGIPPEQGRLRCSKGTLGGRPPANGVEGGDAGLHGAGAPKLKETREKLR